MQRKTWSAIVVIFSFTEPMLAQEADCSGLDPVAAGSIQTAYDCIEEYEQKLETLDDTVSDLLERLDAQASGFEERITVLVQEVEASRAILKDSVVAFHRSEDEGGACPRGWTLYRQAGGRVIVGAGEHENAGLTTYPSYVDNPAIATGGEENVTLTTPQMPAHNHNLSTRTGYNMHDGLAGMDDHASYGLDEVYRDVPNVARWGKMENMISSAGGSQPHNNMPPYIALYFCKKD